MMLSMISALAAATAASGAEGAAAGQVKVGGYVPATCRASGNPLPPDPGASTPHCTRPASISVTVTSPGEAGAKLVLVSVTPL
jgi:hypothetical protein